MTVLLLFLTISTRYDVYLACLHIFAVVLCPCQDKSPLVPYDINTMQSISGVPPYLCFSIMSLPDRSPLVPYDINTIRRTLGVPPYLCFIIMSLPDRSSLVPYDINTIRRILGVPPYLCCSIMSLPGQIPSCSLRYQHYTKYIGRASISLL